MSVGTQLYDWYNPYREEVEHNNFWSTQIFCQRGPVELEQWQRAELGWFLTAGPVTGKGEQRLMSTWDDVMTTFIPAGADLSVAQHKDVLQAGWHKVRDQIRAREEIWHPWIWLFARGWSGK
jgi:hypothetical protein